MILSGIRISEVLLYVCSDNFINYCFIEYIYLVTGELCGDLFCYNVSSEARNWDEANTSCTEMGMSLALRNILNDFSIVLNNTGDDFWVGFRRDDSQSDFIWNDGVTTQPFNENNDNGNGNGNSDCGEISNGVLYNNNCNTNQQYICQRAKGTGKNTS